MAQKNKPMFRIDPSFANDLQEIAKIRLQKGLAKFSPKELGMPEMTKLLRRTQHYKFSLEELKLKPKKENLI